MEIMTCEQIKSNLDAFHDGELPTDVRSSVEQHLGACSNCVNELAQIDRVVHAIKTMPRLEVSSKLSAELDRITDRKVVAFPIKAWAPVAAAAAVAIFVGVKLIAPQQAPITANNVPPQVSPVQQTSVQPEVAQAPKQLQVLHEAHEQPAVQQPVVATQTAVEPPGRKHEKTEASVVAEKPTTKVLPNQAKTPEQVVATNAAPTPSVTISPTATKSGSEDQLAELPSASNALNEAVGIATDEDGLYDLKM